MLKRTLCLLIFLGSAFVLHCQELPFAEKVRRTRNILEKYHYNPISFKEDIPPKIIKKNIELLDPNYLHFIDTDINEFSSSELEDTEFNQKYALLFLKIKKRYADRLQESDSLLDKIKELKLDFNAADYVYYKKKDTASKYCSNEALKYNRLKKWCKNQTLFDYYFKQKKDSIEYTPSRRNQVVDSLAERVIEKLQCNIEKQLLELEKKSNIIEDKAINAITHFYDPHTSYFSPIQGQSFLKSLDMSDLSFGMYFMMNSKGDPILVYLSPGGPAWKSGQLNEGDKLLGVEAEGKPLSLKCITNEEIAEFFGNSNIHNCIIKVEKSNGKIEEVHLVKELLDLEENIINSFVLKGKKKIGYINLPSFYAGIEEAGYNGCSNDLAKEVLKLRNDKIDGLILDLRNNTGGYAFEAINIAGIFIDIGPYSIFKKVNEKAEVLKDVNRGTIYDGPLVIMVNNYSASASELLAGTLQDYNRALVVGSQTFGKATIQINIPLLDTTEFESAYYDVGGMQLPSLKTTVGKFYRVRGNSHQQKGVTPDVELADFFELRKKRESDYKYALKHDSIVKKVYHFNPFEGLPKDSLRALSSARLAKDSVYAEMVSKHEELRGFLKKNNQLQLSFGPYGKHMDSLYMLFDEMEKLSASRTTSYAVSNLKYDAGIYDISEKQAELNEILKKNIIEDYQLKETYNIIIDLINL